MASYTFASSYKLTNIIPADANETYVWNTGLNCVNGEAAVIPDTTVLLPIIKHNQIAIPLYDNRNEYLVLNPGDDVTVNAPNDEAAQFYLNMAIEGALTVEVVSAD